MRFLEMIPLIPVSAMLVIWILTTITIFAAALLVLKRGYRTMGWSLLGVAFGTMGMVLFYTLIHLSIAGDDIDITITISRVLILGNALTLFNAGLATISEFRASY